MRATVGSAAPLFEIKDPGVPIDLSAWISGLAYAAGLVLAASPAMAAEILSLGPRLWVLIASFAAFIACVLLIQRHMRLSLLADSFGAPRFLVTDGVFRYTRNPIYVAFLLPLASIAVFSVWAAAVAILLYVAAMTLTVIRKEERDLLSAFGRNYESYAAGTPRWLLW